MNVKDQIALLGDTGGAVLLPRGTYEITEPIPIDAPCVRLSGEVWNYSADPNGVFEGKAGTKLRVKGNHPALLVGPAHTAEGCLLSDFGIRGDITGMDTRPLFDPTDPAKNAGIVFPGMRVDQAEVTKVSFGGLGCGICACGESELDACRFDRLNLDGCGCGVWFAPRASYYTLFERCVIADNPFFGFYADGSRGMHDLELADLKLVRCAGAFPEGEDAAALYLKNVSDAVIRNCLTDSAGVFWYYSPDAKANSERQPLRRPAVGIRIEGDRNKLLGITVKNSTSDSIVVRGNGNVLLSVFADRDVYVEGDDNVISSLVFTSPGARLHVKGSGNGIGAVFGGEIEEE